MTEQQVQFITKSHSICVVTQQFGKIISGIGLHSNNLVERLVNDGQQVCVIAPVDQRPYGSLPYEFIGVPRSIFRNSQARWLGLSWSFARVLKKNRGQKRFELVHFTDAREALFYDKDTPTIGNVNDTYAADIMPINYYRRYYDDWLLRWMYYRIVSSLERENLPRLHALIANSYFTAGVIKSKYQLHPEKLYICHKSIDIKRYQSVMIRRSTTPLHPPRVLFIGGNMQRKGLPVLIKAAAAILRAVPEAEFWIVGEDRALPHMQALCRKLDVASQFKYLGWKSQADLLEIYSQADIFVMPSLTEAFGVVFLEAMAAGLPVIGTRVGGIPEIISDNNNGILVEPDDPIGLGDAVIRVLLDEDLREQFRQEGLKTAKGFDVDNMMACTYPVYEAVLGLSHHMV